MDALIIKIMSFAQKLVSADRASLFLVDPKSNQLYARLFDVTEKAENTMDISREVRYFLYHHYLMQAFFFADAGLTQGFCNSRFGPNSRIFALTQEKFAVTQLKMVKNGYFLPKILFLPVKIAKFWQNSRKICHNSRKFCHNSIFRTLMCQ